MINNCTFIYPVITDYIIFIRNFHHLLLCVILLLVKLQGLSLQSIIIIIIVSREYLTVIPQ